MENQDPLSVKIKKRRASKVAVTELNEKLGVTMPFGNCVAEDIFIIEESNEEQRNEFMIWKDDQKKSADIAKKMLNSTQIHEVHQPGHSMLNEHPDSNRSFGRFIQKSYNQSNFKQVESQFG